MKQTRKFIAGLLSLFMVAAVAAQDATALFNEGKKLKEEKKTREALDKFKQAIALRPTYAEAHYESGWCYNDLGDYISAISSLRKARTGWSNIPKVHFELGYAFQNTDRPDSAIQCYNRCLELKPDYSLAWKQRGYIHYDREEYGQALEKFEKYEANAKAAITDYKYWYRKGFAHNAQKNYSEAKTALNKSLEFKSDYLNTYLELGFAATKLKQGDEAIGYFMKAKDINPKDHVAYNGIGEVYRDIKKDYATSMSWYRKTLEVKKDERKACYGIGYCLNSTGKYAEAISYLKTAIEKEPDYTAAYVELGYSYYRTDNNAMAIENLNKALAINPQNENAHYYAVLVYVKQKNRAQAQKMVDNLKTFSTRYVPELQKKIDNM